MDLKQLEAFAFVVKLKSFSKAAAKLYLTQPTISAHINTLEKELGVQLIVRTAKEACPTGVGGILYEYALDMLSLRDNAIAACKAEQDRISGHIDIASSTIPYQFVLPKLMSDFRQKYPEVTFNVLNGDSGQVVDSIAAGKAELGMAGSRMERGKCLYREFMDDDLVVITPNNEPYTGITGDAFSPEKLVEYPFVAREPGSGTRKETEELLRKRGVEPSRLRVVAQLDNPDAVKQSVSQGLGISIVSRLSVADYERFGQIRVYPLAGEPMLRKLYFVHHKSRPLSHAAAAFIRFAIRRTEK